MKTVHWGLHDYAPVFAAMQAFTETRDECTEDELWVVEHPPVFTQGMAGKPEHILVDHAIPVVQIDRGGQITYHGPGQLVVYTLIDFRRRCISVRELVTRLENSIITALADYGIAAAADPARPGVYVDGAKIASLGLRIKNGAVYHGLALNVDMDLTPFAYINPCGYAGMAMTQMANYLVPCPPLSEVAARLTHHLSQQLLVSMADVSSQKETD